jgi:Mg/Co/Ni transporter MgtE
MGHGGNTGSQSVTNVIRALALKQISSRDMARVVFKEAGAGCMMGAGQAAWRHLTDWLVGDILYRPECPPPFIHTPAYLNTLHALLLLSSSTNSIGAVLGLCILAFSWVWSGISLEVGAAVAIALPVRMCMDVRAHMHVCVTCVDPVNRAQ